MGRSPCLDKKIGLKKGPWTPAEDQKLIDYINKHGYGNWRTLPKNAGSYIYLRYCILLNTFIHFCLIKILTFFLESC